MSDLLKNTEFTASVFKIDQLPTEIRPTVAIVGRSNAGKSTFINTICRRKQLAKTSKTPGKTRSLNFYSVNKKWFFVDFPGYGYATGAYFDRRDWNELVNAYFERYGNGSSVLFLIDIRRDPDDTDFELINALRERTVPIIYILTKADKVGKSHIHGRAQQFAKAFSVDLSVIIPYSSLEDIGRSEILKTVKRLVTPGLQ